VLKPTALRKSRVRAAGLSSLTRLSDGYSFAGFRARTTVRGAASSAQAAPWRMNMRPLLTAWLRPPIPKVCFASQRVRASRRRRLQSKRTDFLVDLIGDQCDAAFGEGPIRRPIRSTGMNMAISEMLIEMIVKPISLEPLSAASTGE
jgi:hypothetical protein